MPAPGSLGNNELGVVARLASLLGPPRPGEVWVGDDTAVLEVGPGPLLFATDLSIEGVHFDRGFDSDADIGWMSLTTNLSDLAAMGGRPLAAVVGLAGASERDLSGIFEGLADAGRKYSCPIVGGDLSSGVELVVSVAIVGTTDGRPPVLRSGAQAGDELYVTGPLGAAGAALRELRSTTTTTPTSESGRAHRRPLPRLEEGRAAADLGARSMLDLSDGLGIDLRRLAEANGLGAALDEVPVHPGATLEEALGGGGDYELLFAARTHAPIAEGFLDRGLRAPIRIGTLTADPGRLLLAGEAFAPAGYLHDLSERGRPVGGSGSRAAAPSS